MFSRMHTYTLHIYVYIYAYTHIQPIYIHAYICTHACLYTLQTHIKYTCLYTNTNIHTCIYTQAYIHGKLILALKKGKLDKFWDDSFIPSAFLIET